MKKVTFTFVGHKSDHVSEKFYTWVLDGGLEDQIVDRLTEMTDDDVNIDSISDWNNDTLDFGIISKLVQTEENADSNESLSEIKDEHDVFEGISGKGDFTEALNNAIASAKSDLGPYIEWELVTATGINGGTNPQNDLKVKIQADAGPK